MNTLLRNPACRQREDFGTRYCPECDEETDVQAELVDNGRGTDQTSYYCDECGHSHEDWTP